MFSLVGIVLEVDGIYMKCEGNAQLKKEDYVGLHCD